MTDHLVFHSSSSSSSYSLSSEARPPLPLVALLVTFLRKSLRTHWNKERRELCAMEIGWPTNVRHVAHFTFDRFNGFLGLPVEFQPELPSRPPSASRTVFGVSTKSMKLSYDSRGNSVPAILLLMQGRLYAEGGLQTINQISSGINSSSEVTVVMALLQKWHHTTAQNRRLTGSEPSSISTQSDETHLLEPSCDSIDRSVAMPLASTTAAWLVV